MHNCFAHSKSKKKKLKNDTLIHFDRIIPRSHTTRYPEDKRLVSIRLDRSCERGSITIENFAWELTSADRCHLPSTTRRYRFGGDGNGGFSRTKLIHFSRPLAIVVLYNICICVYLARFERCENSKRKRKTRRQRRRRRRLMQIELKTFGFVREEEEAAACLSSGRRQTRMQMRLRNIYRRIEKGGYGEVV